MTKGCSETSTIIFTFTDKQPTENNQNISSFKQLFQELAVKVGYMEKSRTNYQLSHVRTNNQQSHVTPNYQLTNVYINVIEQIVCCIFKSFLFIFTVTVKDIVVVVFAEFLVA